MDKKIRVAGVVQESIVDGPGIRYVVFAQGCNHKCEGCHNHHTHSFDGGTDMDIDTIISDIKNNPLLDGITLSGGEPFEQAEVLSELAFKVKGIGLNVMTYTGYTFEQLKYNKESRKDWGKLISATDILVDGKFEKSRKRLGLKFRGSENQRVIDVCSSLNTDNVVYAEL
jgi:anaerobic ribonucleoside-triphosphate reductase activating protein